MLAGTAAWAAEPATEQADPPGTALQGATAATATTGAQGAAGHQDGGDGSGDHDPLLPVYTSVGAGRPGTTVEVTASLTACDLDRRFDGGEFLDHRVTTHGGHGKKLRHWHVSRDGFYTARYTVSRDDAPGAGVFQLDCRDEDGNLLTGSALFEVRAASKGGDDGTVTRTRGSSSSGGEGDEGSVETPSRIDTGLGGAADGASGEPNLGWLALAAGGAALLGLGTWLIRAGRSRS